MKNVHRQRAPDLNVSLHMAVWHNTASSIATDGVCAEASLHGHLICRVKEGMQKATQYCRDSFLQAPLSTPGPHGMLGNHFSNPLHTLPDAAIPVKGPWRQPLMDL